MKQEELGQGFLFQSEKARGVGRLGPRGEREEHVPL